MEKCQKITAKMESLVETLINDTQAAQDLTEQPKSITEGFKLKENNSTSGVEDPEHINSSKHDCKGIVSNRKVTCGISDYEYFGNNSAAKQRASGRRAGHAYDYDQY